jgi:hypothetical protein
MQDSLNTLFISHYAYAKKKEGEGEGEGVGER